MKIYMSKTKLILIYITIIIIIIKVLKIFQMKPLQIQIIKQIKIYHRIFKIILKSFLFLKISIFFIQMKMEYIKDLLTIYLYQN